MRNFFTNTFFFLATVLFVGLSLFGFQNALAQSVPVGGTSAEFNAATTPTPAGTTVPPTGGQPVGGTSAEFNAATTPTPTITPGPTTATPAPAANSQFVPLTNLPGLVDANSRTLADYLNVLYRLSIGIGALLAVIIIIFAGVKYMSSDAFSSKEEAKKDITAALTGLLIMLSTVVILKFIYPNILNLNVLQELRPVEILSSTPSSAGIPEGGSCTGNGALCAAGAGHCYVDKNTCAQAYGTTAGKCSSSCTPIQQAAKGSVPPEGACTATEDCAGSGYYCGVKGKGASGCDRAQNGEPGQCLTNKCKP